MKKITWIIASLCVLGWLAPCSFAAKGDKANKREKKGKGGQVVQSDVFAQYDKNYNGILDADEKEAIRKDFGTNPTLKQYDTNNDGKLSDEEISAIPATKTAPAEAKKGRKKNK